MKGTGARRADDVLSLAVLLLEAGRAADPGLLLEASLRVRHGTDPDLALRLAQAAWNGGRTPRAGHVVGRLLVLQGRYPDPAAYLAAAAKGSDAGPPQVPARPPRLVQGMFAEVVIG